MTIDFHAWKRRCAGIGWYGWIVEQLACLARNSVLSRDVSSWSFTQHLHLELRLSRIPAPQNVPEEGTGHSNESLLIFQ